MPWGCASQRCREMPSNTSGHEQHNGRFRKMAHTKQEEPSGERRQSTLALKLSKGPHKEELIVATLYLSHSTKPDIECAIHFNHRRPLLWISRTAAEHEGRKLLGPIRTHARHAEVDVARASHLKG
eukprot:scaffold76261_cov33-Tisochrysis_lutea.AAC.2